MGCKACAGSRVSLALRPCACRAHLDSPPARLGPVAGVLPEHSTFQLISQHAQRVRAHQNTQPPAPECGLDCWVLVEGPFSMLRRWAGAQGRECLAEPHQWQRCITYPPAALPPFFVQV